MCSTYTIIRKIIHYFFSKGSDTCDNCRPKGRGEAGGVNEIGRIGGG